MYDTEIMNMEWVALVIFIFTYALIAIHKFRGVEINRSLAALLGGGLIIIFGIVSLSDAFRSINFDVIFLLLGMMALVAGLDYCGLFSVISDHLIRRSGSRIKLLAIIMALTAVLSAVALNDAIVLMFTPIVIRCCSKIKTNPIPYLVGMMMSANIGSVATAVGNPQNAYIATRAGIDFIKFSQYLIPVSLICLFITFFFIWLFYRKRLTEPYAEIINNCEERPRDILRLRIMMCITVLMFIGFMTSGSTRIPLHWIALTAGVLSAMVIASKSIGDVKWLAKRINWSVLLFFTGLFVLIAGVVQTGLINDIGSLFPGFGNGETPSVLTVSLFSAVLSNLVSNVPAVMLISEMIPVNDLSLWLALAASSTLAGNATLIGSAANIIVAEKSEDYGIKFNFFRFLKVGIIVTVVTVLISIAVLELML